MFYRSAADNKLASLEARISRLENRISKRAAGGPRGGTIEYLTSGRGNLIHRLGSDLGIPNLERHWISEGNSIQFDQSVIEDTDGVELNMITDIDGTNIQVRLTRGFGRNTESKSFIMQWNASSEIHPMGLARKIKEKAMMFDLL